MAEITLRGEVGIDITLWQVVSEIKNIPAPEPIVIRLTSEGGSAIEGRDIYHYLKSLQMERDITIIADTFVASAAFTILLGAAKRVAAHSATEFVMHSPMFFGVFLGDDVDAKQLAAEIRKEKDLYIDIYSRELGITPELAEQLMEKDQIIGTDVALKMGVVNEIRSEEKVLAYKIAAKSYLNNQHNELLTKKQNTMSENLEKQIEENTSLLKQVKAWFSKNIKALKIATDEGVELEFEGDELAVGVNVTTGEDGTYTLMYNERKWTVVIAEGVVTELTEIVDEEEETEDVEALKTQIAEQAAEIERLKGLQAKMTDMEKMITEIKSIATPFMQPDGTYKFKAESQTTKTAEEVSKEERAARMEKFKQERFGNKSE